MSIWWLDIQFLEKLTVRDFLEINKVNLKFQNKEIDELTFWNELIKIAIVSVNGETDKKKIEDYILWMDSLEEYTKLNEIVAEKINAIVDPVKKKK